MLLFPEVSLMASFSLNELRNICSTALTVGLFALFVFSISSRKKTFFGGKTATVLSPPASQNLFGRVHNAAIRFCKGTFRFDENNATRWTPNDDDFVSATTPTLPPIHIWETASTG